MKKMKGSYGYRDKRKKRMVLLVLLFLAAILVQLWARTLTDDSAKKNILTVMAVLTVLPMANIASPMLAAWRFHTPPESFYHTVSVYETSTRLLYDLIITSRKQILPFDAVAVYPDSICAYCSDSRADTEKAEEYLSQMFQNARISMGVKVVKEEKVFLRRLESGKAVVGEPSQVVEDAAQLLMQISM